MRNNYDMNKYHETIAKKETSFLYKINHIDKQEFINDYINNNKSREYMKDKYNLSEYMIDKIINYYACNKSRKQSAELVLQTKYNKFGNKESYYNYLTPLIKQSKIDHYGSIEEAYRQTSINCSKAWANKSKEEIKEIINKSKKTNLDKYGVESCFQLQSARLKGNNSKPNKEFSEKLDSQNIKYTREFNLKSKSYDFKVNDILIEINPTATHNSTYGIYDNPPMDSNYHLNKTLLAKENDFRCIHIFDWDAKDKIINLLKPKQIIYARKCDIKEINSNYIINDFLNTHHIQSTCRNQKICLGLFYNNKLIQLMTFGKPRYNKNYQFELLRLCTHFDYKVVGGSERLFKYFLNTYNPKSIISYCDNSKFNGDVYNRLGFTLKSFGKPNLHWHNIKLNIHINHSLLIQRGFDQLLGNLFGTFGKGTDNNTLMLNHGFVQVFDCGQSIYEYIK